MGACFGQICICCFGCRSSPLSPVGWARINSLRGPLHFMVWCCCWLPSHTIFLYKPSFLCMAEIRYWQSPWVVILKAKISTAIYFVAIPLAFVNTGLAFGVYVLVAIMWLVRIRRIERTIAH